MRATWWMLGLALAGCGGDAGDPAASPASGSRGATPPGRERGAKLSPEEVQEALRRAGGVDLAAARAEIERASSEATRHLGGDAGEVARKGQAMADRRLTSADVETYLALLPKVREGGATPEVVGAQGISVIEWHVLRGRMEALLAMLEMNTVPKSVETRADLETARPFAARLREARRGP